MQGTFERERCTSNEATNKETDGSTRGETKALGALSDCGIVDRLHVNAMLVE